MSSPRLERYIPAVQAFTARVMLFHLATARRIGLNATEFNCFRLAGADGGVTATALAKETGLSLPAVTAVVDRLEALGFVRRERDRGDRRKVAIRVVTEAKAKVDALYADYSVEMAKLLDSYDDRQFEFLLRYFAQASALLLRAQSADEAAGISGGSRK